MPKIAVIGHSHTLAFLDAISEWRPSSIEPEWLPPGFAESYRGWFSSKLDGSALPLRVKPGFEAFEGARTVLFSPHANAPDLAKLRNDGGTMTIELADRFKRCLVQITDCDTVVSVLEGGAVCLLNEYPDYDFAPFDGGDHRPIDSKYIIEAVIEQAMRVVTPLIALRTTIPGARIIHLGPLPPLEQPPDGIPLEQFAEPIAKYGLARPALRLKWFYLFRSELRRLLMRSGIPMIDEPAEALTERGFLRPEYAASLTHANAAYGALMAAQVRPLLPA
jgi:hypothetical protein